MARLVAWMPARVLSRCLSVCVLMIVLGAALPASAQGPLDQDDAGTGGDAPTGFNGAPVLTDGTYSGVVGLGISDLGDSFLFEVPAGHRIEARMLTEQPGPYPFVYMDLYDHTESQGTLFVAYDDPYLGFAAHDVTVGIQLWPSLLGPGVAAAEYTFSIAKIPIAQDDAGSGQDAAGSHDLIGTSDPLPVVPGLLHGNLSKYDTRDRYTYEAAQPLSLTIALTHPGTESLTLETACRDSDCGFDAQGTGMLTLQTYLAAGDAVTVDIEYTNVNQVDQERLAAVPYQLALTAAPIGPGKPIPLPDLAITRLADVRTSIQPAPGVVLPQELHEEHIIEIDVHNLGYATAHDVLVILEFHGDGPGILGPTILFILGDLIAGEDISIRYEWDTSRRLGSYQVDALVLAQTGDELDEETKENNGRQIETWVRLPGLPFGI